MNATEYFEAKHGKMCHSLPKSEILNLMNCFSDHRHQTFLSAKEKFNSEQFFANEELKRKTFPKKDK